MTFPKLQTLHRVRTRNPASQPLLLPCPLPYFTVSLNADAHVVPVRSGFHAAQRGSYKRFSPPALQTSGQDSSLLKWAVPCVIGCPAASLDSHPQPPVGQPPIFPDTTKCLLGDTATVEKHCFTLGENFAFEPLLYLFVAPDLESEKFMRKTKTSWF